MVATVVWAEEVIPDGRISRIERIDRCNAFRSGNKTAGSRRSVKTRCHGTTRSPGFSSATGMGRPKLKNGLICEQVEYYPGASDKLWT